MVIYPLFESEKAERITLHPPKPESQKLEQKRRFSSVSARLFFIVLLVGDILWFTYCCLLLTLAGLTSLMTFGKVHFLKKMTLRAWLSLKRSLVCVLALIVALFSPAYGIMVASTYFIMYDKTGLEEVIPASIRSAFGDLFK